MCRKFVEVVSRLSDDDLARPATDFGPDEEGKSLLAVLIQHHRGYVETIVARG